MNLIACLDIKVTSHLSCSARISCLDNLQLVSVFCIANRIVSWLSFICFVLFVTKVSSSGFSIRSRNNVFFRTTECLDHLLRLVRIPLSTLVAFEFSRITLCDTSTHAHTHTQTNKHSIRCVIITSGQLSTTTRSSCPRLPTLTVRIFNRPSIRPALSLAQLGPFARTALIFQYLLPAVLAGAYSPKHTTRILLLLIPSHCLECLLYKFGAKFSIFFFFLHSTALLVSSAISLQRRRVLLSHCLLHFRHCTRSSSLRHDCLPLLFTSVTSHRSHPAHTLTSPLHLHLHFRCGDRFSTFKFLSSFDLEYCVPLLFTFFFTLMLKLSNNFLMQIFFAFRRSVYKSDHFFFGLNFSRYFCTFHHRSSSASSASSDSFRNCFFSFSIHVRFAAHLLDWCAVYGHRVRSAAIRVGRSIAITFSRSNQQRR